ncbi:branched-chain amino acid ABC transporter permease [Alcaligenaceae bacterium]|nr:branched-chain amino acid ABC transporter permease [Alcaligenaceae bacterium]
MNTVMQLIVSGLTVGAIYALVALGFTLIYRASDIFNFAQGEFFMLGGMITGVVFASQSGSYLTAALLAVVITVLFGAALYVLAINQAKSADTIQLLILTIGAAMLASGLASAILGKDFVTLPTFFEQEMLVIGGVVIQTQALVVMAGAALIVVGLWVFLGRTLTGKAIVAVASNSLGAQLVGINRLRIVTACFALSALIGAVGGVLATPITLTSYDTGTMLAIKGFTGAMLGGMGTPYGPVIGGLLIGLLEAFGAGLLSSVYKDAFALIVLLAVFAFQPQGIFSARSVERV